MNYFFLLSGIILFAFTTVDIIKTTFSSKGGGLLTSILSRAIWRLFFVASGKRGTSTLLSYAGPCILVTVLFYWITGLWGGLLLMLLSEPDSILNSTTRTAGGFWEKVYYAGFTLSTLGVGDYTASSDLWRVVTSLSAFSGLAFITASITYFVPVLQAVGLQSRLSLYISSMGKTPYQIIRSSWNGKDFTSFFDNTSDICQMLMQHTMHHHSYPVIHYFHNKQPGLAISPAIVTLTETYHLLRHAVSDQASIDQLKMSMLQTTIDAYLNLVKREFLERGSPKEKAPAPVVEEMEGKGIPLHREDELRATLEHTSSDRRKILALLLESDGWSWENVYGEN